MKMHCLPLSVMLSESTAACTVLNWPDCGFLLTTMQPGGGLVRAAAATSETSVESTIHFILSTNTGVHSSISAPIARHMYRNGEEPSHTEIGGVQQHRRRGMDVCLFP